jgi:hypothetical protein
VHCLLQTVQQRDQAYLPAIMCIKIVTSVVVHACMFATSGVYGYGRLL